MITCNLHEQNKIQFEMEITGVQIPSDAKTYLSVIDGTTKYSFEVQRTGNQYSVTIPVLVNILRPTQYKCEINVQLGSRMFTPLSQYLMFIDQGVNPTITNVSVNDQAEEVEPITPPTEPEIAVTPTTEETVDQPSFSKETTNILALAREIDKQASGTPPQIKESTQSIKCKPTIDIPTIKFDKTKIEKSKIGIDFRAINEASCAPKKATKPVVKSDVKQVIDQIIEESDTKNKPLFKMSKSKIV